jgi:hypothetical protein
MHGREWKEGGQGPRRLSHPTELHLTAKKSPKRLAGDIPETANGRTKNSSLIARRQTTELKGTRRDLCQTCRHGLRTLT